MWLGSGAARYAIYGTMLAELEVQRTINRAEFWAFRFQAWLARPPSIRTTCAFWMDCGEEEKVVLDKGRKTLTYGISIWEFLMDCAEKVEEQFVMEGNEKADELAKDGADVDGGAMAAAKALTVQQLRT